ncbi:hypothetical protein GCM10025762_42710 [Haloechinothrix salitolerans]
MNNTDLLSGHTETHAQTQTEQKSESGSDNVTVETTPRANGETATPKRRSGGLSGMVIAELRELAGELGISDTSGMRKGDLIAAIRERQGKAKRKPATKSATKSEPKSEAKAESTTEANAEPKSEANAEAKAEASSSESGAATRQPAATTAPSSSESGSQAGTNEPAASNPAATTATTEQGTEPSSGQSGSQGTGKGDQDQGGGRRDGGRRRRGASRPGDKSDQGGDSGDKVDKGSDKGDKGSDKGDKGSDKGQDKSDKGQDKSDKGDGGQGDARRQNNRNDRNRNDRNDRNDDDDDGRGGRRGRRSRDRRRRGRGGEGGGPDTEIREDDVLLPVAGILDVLDNYAFVRTSGYLAGPNDVYVSLSFVRKYGLRRGDAITGVVRQPREGEQQRQKFNPLVRVDSVNGLEPEKAKQRAEFHKLTPLYPNERLRLETEPHKLTTRVIDLVMPVGKGQRALIVSPPKAGKTTILQDLANAIATNNPECWLMVVLVDERPEEVTDMERNVKGEVISSTFDRPPSDHTTVAELSIERAKRLVEMGHDVVVLLDSITRLGRAYNLAAPASGRILSGGVDSTALYPPKRFLGAARNIENGGSLTIFATAMVETGSTMDTVIFEEFKGTGNAELKLDRKIAERRVFPAVDVNPSGTRKEELLLSPDELAVTVKLHRVLHALDSQQAIDLLIDRLKKSKTNIEFLMQVSKTAPGQDEE